MKYLLYLVVIFLLPSFSFAQQNEAKSKAFYFSAEEAFKGKKYDDALSLLEKSEEAGGATNAYIEALKAKSYAAKEDWINTKQTLDVCYLYNPNDDILKDLSPIILQIDSEYEKAIKAEEKRLVEQQETILQNFKNEQAELLEEIKAEETRLETAIAHYEKAYNFLKTFKTLKEGYPYLINTKSISGLDYEKSVFIFYGDQYIIYTIPNIGYVKNLFKDQLAFDASSGNNAMRRLVKHKNSSGKKSEEYFKRSPQYSNVFHAEKGLLWVGQQYTTFTDEIYYYYADKYENTSNFGDVDLYADTDIKKDLGIYLNPYIKTGNIIKEVNYNYIVDDALKNEFLEHGFTQTGNSSVPVERMSAERETFRMLFPHKEVTYVLVDDNAKDKDSKQKYLYFEEKESTMYYGYVSYDYLSKNQLSDIMGNIQGINTDFILDEVVFNKIYNGIKKEEINDFIWVYQSPYFTTIFETITDIYGYFETLTLTP